MIIKLKGADFSADNIGKVQITTALHPFTLAAIEASGNTSITMEQKSALNDLFLAMGVDGSNDTMSKIRRLYLPIIAGDVTKALINYNTTEMVVDMELSSSSWTLRSNGLVGIGGDQAITLVEDRPLQPNNWSSFFLRTELMERGVDDGSFTITLRGQTNTDAFLGLRQQSLSKNGAVSFGGYGADWGDIWDKEKDAIRVSGLTNKNGVLHRCILGEWSSTNSPTQYNADMSQETKQTVYALGLGIVQTTKPYAAMMIGEGIDADIAKNICEKIDALYQTFL